MVLVRAALGDDTEHRARVAAKFGGELISHQADFLHQVWIVERLLATRHARVVDVLAVQHEVVRTHAAAVGRVAHAGGEARLAAAQLADSGR